MDDGVREELRRLRARAYGPGADISDDPAAYARLLVLEDLERTERTEPVAPSPEPSVPAGVEASVGVAPVDPASLDDDADAEAEDERARERAPLVRSKRTVWAWALSLAIVAALASAATTAGVGFVPVAASVGAPQVATLMEDPGTQIPTIFGQRTGDERAFADFYGVTAFVGTAQIDASENRSACLYLLDTDEVGQDGTTGFRGNFVYGGCGAGIFPATVQFVVAEGMPEAFTSRFPIGTSVQFVYDGENVGVFSDAG
ncbi:hypothetical protein SAMN04487848_2757 [Microbacterium sp. ru370.1]|uniref:hypothetical protein n=1 Tax=unclassified Microbacterium TaxID=2609290 RepID=UPI00088CB527|nr:MULTISPECIES: hypothetical protein [unclassified Microbacterium]SDO96768.1 hypothetical protein SAMN04487848_2757 [Microbacterium sp. ru370.1]SIT92856.1 hypothetical protein SAMN05880579_2823 [Microbacterium sp. RU1D]